MNTTPRWTWFHSKTTKLKSGKEGTIKLKRANRVNPVDNRDRERNNLLIARLVWSSIWLISTTPRWTWFHTESSKLKRANSVTLLIIEREREKSNLPIASLVWSRIWLISWTQKRKKSFNPPWPHHNFHTRLTKTQQLGNWKFVPTFFSYIYISIYLFNGWPNLCSHSKTLDGDHQKCPPGKCTIW